ncbi:MAG: SDR family oxidoreductase [Acidobacteriota bacterium]
MEKILVTGGAGFIGSNLAEYLLKKNYDIRILDNLSTGKIENIKDFLNSAEFQKGDLTNPKDLKKSLKNIECVVHLAAIPSVERSVKDPLLTNKANVEGTLNLLVAARETKVSKIIFASSSSIYGDTPELPKKESFMPNPLSPYAISKVTGEYYCKVFKKIYNLDVIILRFFNIFGPKQDPLSPYSGVISIFINKIRKNEKPEIFGDGSQTRDFTYIENVNEAIEKSINVSNPEEIIFNIGCGNRYSVNDLFQNLKEITGFKENPIYREPRKGDVKDSQANIELAKKFLGWKPKVDFKEGLKKTVEYYFK